MSLYIDLSINGDPIGGTTVTRHMTGEDGIHVYDVFYEGRGAQGQRQAARGRFQHKESDGAAILASKALGEIQRALQLAERVR